MDRITELAASIIDMISDIIEEEHPEIIIQQSEDGDGNDALIHGVAYYELEDTIVAAIRSIVSSN